MGTVTVLCDRVADVGGAERYWETVLPALASRGIRVGLLAREIGRGCAPGLDARALGWADDDGPPSAAAARAVAEELRRERPERRAVAANGRRYGRSSGHHTARPALG